MRALVGGETARDRIAARDVGGVHAVLAGGVVDDHPSGRPSRRLGVVVVEDHRVRARAHDGRIGHARGAAGQAGPHHRGLERVLEGARLALRASAAQVGVRRRARPLAAGARSPPRPSRGASRARTGPRPRGDAATWCCRRPCATPRPGARRRPGPVRLGNRGRSLRAEAPASAPRTRRRETPRRRRRSPRAPSTPARNPVHCSSAKFFGWTNRTNRCPAAAPGRKTAIGVGLGKAGEVPEVGVLAVGLGGLDPLSPGSSGRPRRRHGEGRRAASRDGPRRRRRAAPRLRGPPASSRPTLTASDESQRPGPRRDMRHSFKVGRRFIALEAAAGRRDTSRGCGTRRKGPPGPPEASPAAARGSPRTSR